MNLLELPLEIIYMIFDNYQHLINIPNKKIMAKTYQSHIQTLYTNYYNEILNIALTCKIFYNYWFKNLLELNIIEYNNHNLMKYELFCKDKMLISKDYKWLKKKPSINENKILLTIERFQYIDNIYKNFIIDSKYYKKTHNNVKRFIIPKQIFYETCNYYNYMIDFTKENHYIYYRYTVSLDLADLDLADLRV